MTLHVVTGANRGIGLELVRQLVGRGEEVVATARRPERAGALAELGARVEPLDVADEESVARFARALRDAAVDALWNNAGVGVGRTPLGELDYEEIRRAFEVNALGALRVTEALLPSLRRGSKKLVLNVTSKMGSIDDNTSGGSYAYRASKAALNMITKSLAVDLAGAGFTCVVLHPGWVRTGMGGSAAPLSVEESVEGLLRVVGELSPARSGSFLDYSGTVLPW